MSFKWDRQNRLVEYVIDGARWTGFLDDAGHVTELRDAQNNSHAPVRLTRHEAEAAGETLRTGLQRVISECAPMVTNKCGLDDLNFSSPAGKMICADDMFSEDSWMIALASEFDTSWLEVVYELTEQQLVPRPTMRSGRSVDQTALLGTPADVFLGHGWAAVPARRRPPRWPPMTRVHCGASIIAPAHFPMLGIICKRWSASRTIPS